MISRKARTTIIIISAIVALAMDLIAQNITPGIISSILTILIYTCIGIEIATCLLPEVRNRKELCLASMVPLVIAACAVFVITRYIMPDAPGMGYIVKLLVFLVFVCLIGMAASDHAFRWLASIFLKAPTCAGKDINQPGTIEGGEQANPATDQKPD